MKLELEQLLEQAQATISKLEDELQAARAELAEREAVDTEWQARLAAVERDAELQLCCEREKIRRRMEQAHKRELRVHGDLRRSVKLRLVDKEPEVKALRRDDGSIVASGPEVAVGEAIVEHEGTVEHGAGDREDSRPGGDTTSEVSKAAGVDGSEGGVGTRATVERTDAGHGRGSLGSDLWRGRIGLLVA